MQYYFKGLNINIVDYFNRSVGLKQIFGVDWPQTLFQRSRRYKFSGFNTPFFSENQETDFLK
ncbi:MAG: hypothetical protein AMJ79_01110 [Phycisphaerae bacterium SM23_30]|nr:MAG: hypothetical protein AMJ79_01110 [Phycisphaerae bacterium SM23_30]